MASRQRDIVFSATFSEQTDESHKYIRNAFVHYEPVDLSIYIFGSREEFIVSLSLQASRITGVRLVSTASAQLSLKRCLPSQFIMASTPWCWRTVGQTDKLWVFLPGCSQKPMESTEALLQAFLQRFDIVSSNHLGVCFAFPMQYHVKFDSYQNADKKTRVQGMFVCLDLINRKKLREQCFELRYDVGCFALCQQAFS